MRLTQVAVNMVVCIVCATALDQLLILDPLSLTEHAMLCSRDMYTHESAF